jgi:hypothetical protein
MPPSQSHFLNARKWDRHRASMSRASPIFWAARCDLGSRDPVPRERQPRGRQAECAVPGHRRSAQRLGLSGRRTCQDASLGCAGRVRPAVHASLRPGAHLRSVALCAASRPLPGPAGAPGQRSDRRDAWPVGCGRVCRRCFDSMVTARWRWARSRIIPAAGRAGAGPRARRNCRACGTAAGFPSAVDHARGHDARLCQRRAPDSRPIAALGSFDGPDESYPDAWVAAEAVETLRELASRRSPGSLPSGSSNRICRSRLRKSGSICTIRTRSRCRRFPAGPRSPRAGTAAASSAATTATTAATRTTIPITPA